MGKRASIYILDSRDPIEVLVNKINHNFKGFSQDNTITNINVDKKDARRHNELADRDVSNCHPIQAIENLTTTLNEKYKASELSEDLLENTKKKYPISRVYMTTSDNMPSYLNQIGTWTKIGSQTIGSKTVNYFERTA